jgi:hypothetical protein
MGAVAMQAFATNLKRVHQPLSSRFAKALKTSEGMCFSINSKGNDQKQLGCKAVGPSVGADQKQKLCSLSFFSAGGAG